ncbi:MAG TPA: hypothetical protein VM914_12120 [Pyrinomonadaceae bacterium]|nr:hypothetical protein [Pyrinomonadaceae bacterium]
MRHSAVVTALTAAFAFAALATDARALKLAPGGGRASALASVADAGDGAARNSEATAAASPANGGGGGSSNVVKYAPVSARRARRFSYALACATVVALLLIAFAVRKRMRSRLS